MISCSVALVSAATSPDETSLASPDGIFTITPVQDRSCIVVRVPLDAKHALTGIRWFNNDDQTPFARILVASGLNEIPPMYGDARVVATDIAGARMDWSALQFNEPIASLTESLYLIFQLAQDIEGVGEAEGPGIGYIQAADAPCVFLSTDGDEWARMKTGFRLLIEPILAVRDPSAVALAMSRPTPEDNPTPDVPTVTRLGTPYPNPFNPQVSVAFDVARSVEVELRVFDVRGHLVRELVRGPHSAGRYVVQWYGKNEHGARVASGVYFVRFRAGTQSFTRRLVMIK